MPELSVDKAVAIAVETTSGTWEAPTMAANAIRVASRPQINPAYALPGIRDGATTGGFGVPPSATPGGRWASVDLEVELNGSGTVDTAPAIGVLLRPFTSETVVPTTSVDYAIDNTVQDTLSILIQQGGKEYQIRGAVPTSSVLRGAEGDNRVIIATTLAGIMDVAPIEQAIEAQTFNNQSAQPAEFQGALSIGGVAMLYPSFELDMGLEARAFRVDRGQTNHLVYGIVTQVNPVLTTLDEVRALSTHNPFSAQADPGTALALSLTIGTAVGNTFVITADHAEFDPDGVRPEENDRLEFWNLTASIRNAGGNFLTISHQ